MTEKNETPTLKISPLLSDDDRVEVGCNTYGNPKLLLWSESEKIKIGKYCSIADEVCIFGGGEHRVDWVTTYPLRIAFGLEGASQDGHPASKGPTLIGNDVWIGYGAKILSGVTVGHGAVIAAGAVVAKDVTAYSIVTGNPATLNRYRFEKEEIEALLAIQWWDWPQHEIVEAAPFLSSHQIGTFIQYATEKAKGGTPHLNIKDLTEVKNRIHNLAASLKKRLPKKTG